MKNPEQYGRYLCLFESHNSISKSNYWDVISWYNHFQNGDCWNIDQEKHQGDKIVRFFLLPNFNKGLFAESGDEIIIVPNETV